MPKAHWDISYQEYRKAMHGIIRTEKGDCPGRALLRILQGKWKYSILYALSMQEPRRFGELRRMMPEITKTMLAASLRELEEDGLIARHQYDEMPPRVEYTLTEKGEDLGPVFYAMTRWGLKYIP